MAIQTFHSRQGMTREKALAAAWSDFKMARSPVPASCLGDMRKDEISRRFKLLSLLTVYREGVVLRGGGYLHFFHGLQREPTDIDFITSVSPSMQIHLETAKELADYGIEVTTHKPCQKSNGGIFFSFKLIWPEDYCQVQVEFSKRDPLLPPIQLRMEEFGHVFEMRGLSLQEQGMQKIKALLQRDVPTPRDVIDLYYLITEKQILFDLDFVKQITSGKPGREPYSLGLFSQKLSEIGQRLENMYSSVGLRGIIDFGLMQKSLMDWISGKDLKK